MFAYILCLNCSCIIAVHTTVKTCPKGSCTMSGCTHESLPPAARKAERLHSALGRAANYVTSQTVYVMCFCRSTGSGHGPQAASKTAPFKPSAATSIGQRMCREAGHLRAIAASGFFGQVGTPIVDPTHLGQQHCLQAPGIWCACHEMMQNVHCDPVRVD